ncbi:ABC transporter permease subunit [Ancylobacter sp. 6x-1]|uniref:ABC transporter permease subunit n=1 Tax=Ancylobacter crimeensis TaxID=2579147 RepID=A0ABT0DEL5_9HYPH|nr:ABC transporter permease subunit [Ancylobacter crimeensis]MCK0198197.1 ABC transporter permease subunit [Ancylobacter crimeensis]
MHLLSFGDQGYGDELFYGALLTMSLAVVGYLTSLICGVLIAVATLRPFGVRWTLWRLYASCFMSVPALLVIFLIYFGGAEMVSAALRLMGVSVRVQVTPFAAGAVGLGVVYSAYLAEGVRAAILNVPRGQFEAAQALQLSRLQMWSLVIAPQATRLALPGLVNLWIVVLKDTALISLVGLKDIIAQAKMAAGVTKEPFLFYIAAALFFVFMNGLTLHVSGWLDRHVARGMQAARS